MAAFDAAESAHRRVQHPSRRDSKQAVCQRFGRPSPAGFTTQSDQSPRSRSVPTFIRRGRDDSAGQRNPLRVAARCRDAEDACCEVNEAVLRAARECFSALTHLPLRLAITLSPTACLHA
jgi:hypothetical protein